MRKDLGFMQQRDVCKRKHEIGCVSMHDTITNSLILTLTHKMVSLPCQGYAAGDSDVMKQSLQAALQAAQRRHEDEVDVMRS